jgi:hypothetical protein
MAAARVNRFPHWRDARSDTNCIVEYFVRIVEGLSTANFEPTRPKDYKVNLVEGSESIAESLSSLEMRQTLTRVCCCE